MKLQRHEYVHVSLSYSDIPLNSNTILLAVYTCTCTCTCIYVVVLFLGDHSGDAMWVVRVDMSAKDLLSPIPNSQDWAHGVPA